MRSAVPRHLLQDVASQTSAALPCTRPLLAWFTRSRGLTTQLQQAVRDLLPMHQRDVVVVGAARTPFGALQGGLAPLSACQLGAAAIKAALERAGLAHQHVQEVFMGNVCSAGLGQAPARQAALGAGLPPSTVCTTVNKVCSSGMKAIMLGAQSIQTGLNDVVVAGGMESMSNVPYYLERARSGYRMGHGQLTDGMIKDGLWDPYSNQHMGECAELCAAELHITRAEQDAHAAQSAERATRARQEGWTAHEIAPLEVPGRKGQPATWVDSDEALAKMDAARLPKLAPVFAQDKSRGTVTAGNASPITDGAAAVVLMSSEKASQLGLKVLAHVAGMGDAEQEPQRFPTSPALAVPKALTNASIAKSDVDYWELNEAFSLVHLANARLLGLDPARVNAHGGAVALGHPIGASGCAIVVRLLNILHTHDAATGVAAICNGGGGASALVLRRTLTPSEREEPVDPNVAECGQNGNTAASCKI